MVALNSGSSVYHGIYAMYWRSTNGSLITLEGDASEELRAVWPEVWGQFQSRSGSAFKTGLQFNKVVDTFTLAVPCALKRGCKEGVQSCLRRFRETYEKDQKLILGIMTSTDAVRGDFRDRAEIFILLETRFLPLRRMSSESNTEKRRIAEHVSNLFDRRLRNVSSKDRWEAGRAYFENRVFGFVERGLRIQFCLPAFPCKSPNQQKVGGQTPDAAECIALTTLQEFLREIGEIYEPGADLIVVSDGHVFSDCIGVDDETVTKYNERLKMMYADMFGSDKHTSIEFLGLSELLFSEDRSSCSDAPDWTDCWEVSHPIETVRTPMAEISRRAMMALCAIDRSQFRALLAEKESQTLATYRGMSRFMFHDLANPFYTHASSSQRKKIASSVAAEMILRNQAYSNLIELLFPNHIRLSIHAHPNAGPKFGIRLFQSDSVRVIDSIQHRSEMKSFCGFQQPTPWHNCIIKIEDEAIAYLGKAELAREAIRSGEFEGGWVAGPGGAHFALRRSCSAGMEEDEGLDGREMSSP